MSQLSPPFFSIVLPTYNRSKFLNKTIDSILAQKFDNWELIIVDDGSIDDTNELVGKYLDKRINYIYQENQERCVARNNGINLAKGEYVCFIDSDDEYCPNHLSIIYQKISDSSKAIDLIFTNYSISINNSSPTAEQITPINIEVNLETYFLKHTIIPSRISVRKEVLEKIKFPVDVVISEDTYFLIQLANSYHNIIQISEATIIYNVHNSNSVNFKLYNAYLQRKQTLKLIKEQRWASRINKKEFNEVINNCDFGIYKHYFYNNKKLKAALSIALSLITNFQHRKKEKAYYLLNTFSSTFEP